MPESNAEISNLLTQARYGQNDAIAALLEAYRNYLSLLARVQINKQFRGRVSPSDVVQETFMQAQTAFRDFRGKTEFELMAWLRRLLASKISNMARHHSAQRRDIHLEQQVDRALEESSVGLASFVDHRNASPSGEAIKREQAVLLADAIGRLPDDYRELIILRHLECKSFPEIASQLDKTLPSVKSIWTRAVNKLRDELKELP